MGNWFEEHACTLANIGVILLVFLLILAALRYFGVLDPILLMLQALLGF